MSNGEDFQRNVKITANNVALLEVSMNVGLADKNAQGYLISWRFACGQPKQPHFTGICLNLFKKTVGKL